MSVPVVQAEVEIRRLRKSKGALGYRLPFTRRLAGGSRERCLATVECISRNDSFGEPASVEKPSAAFPDVLPTYGRRLHQVAFRITRNHADAEDAVQDALLSAYEKYGSFRGDSSLYSWLYRITTNSALMIVRKSRRWKHAHAALRMTFETDLHPRIKSQTPEQMLVEARLADALGKGVAGLKPGLRGPISDYLREGTNLKELSRRHGLTVGATKIRIHRAKLSLREQLRAHVEMDRPAKRSKRGTKGTECSP